MPGLLIAPSREADFVELGATRKGRLFRKHILNKGTLLYPGVAGGKVEVDDEFITRLTENFDKGVCDIVQVPLAGAKNEHTEEPDRNIGQVVGIEAEGDKVYALIDARKHAEDLGNTLLGASAMMSLDYTDTKTGEKAGPTLLHVAVTNRPYVTGLDDYQEVVAASASEYSGDPIMLTPAPAVTAEKDDPMTLEEMLAALKKDHNIDVPALQTAAAQVAATAQTDAALTQLTQTLASTGLVQLTNGEQITTKDVVTAVAQLAGKNVELSGTVESLVKDKHVAEVQRLVDGGYIEPAKQEAMLALKLSNEDLFSQLVPAEPVVKLNNESGITPPDSQPTFDVDKEVERALSLARDKGMSGVTA